MKSVSNESFKRCIEIYKEIFYQVITYLNLNLMYRLKNRESFLNFAIETE